MIIKFIEKRIQRAFSNAALHYDILTSLHKEIGRELLDRIVNAEKEGAKTILEIGMGTGWLTHRLTSLFPESLIVGIDFAPGMIQMAQKKQNGFHTIQADACQLPFQDNIFDVIVSNLTYQWIGDLSLGFRACFEKLKTNGLLFLTMFGYHTFSELFDSLENAKDSFPNKKALEIRRLAQKDQVAGALHQAGFSHVQLDSERIKAHFPDMMDLLQWTKAIGANLLERDSFVGKDLLGRAGDYYQQRYQDPFGVTASLEIIWVMARKK